MTIQRQFDLKTWIARFPLTFTADAIRVATGGTTPRAIVYREQLLALLQNRIRLDGGVPTDAYVFGTGEPPDRDMTKIGGLPYWPRSLDWPIAADGKPYMFLAQLRIRDSADILPFKIPDDVLLVFVHPDFLASAWSDDLYCCWLPFGIADLITDDCLPSTGLPYPLWAVSHRTFDFSPATTGEIIAAEWKKVWVDCGLPYGRLLRHVREFCIIRAVKVGGRSVLNAAHASSAAKTDRLISGFLCALREIWPGDENLPWINASGPVDDRSVMVNHEYFDFRDGFDLVFEMAHDRTLHYTFQMR